MTCLRFSLVLTLVLVLSTASYAGVPYLISYQGRLADAGGNPLPEGTLVTVTFSIYDDSTSGLLLWSETKSVTIGKDGQFRDFLGSLTPLSDAVFSGPNRYLSMAVMPDPEMRPRTRLVSSPYAFRLGSVDGAKGGVITSPVSIGSTPPKSQLTLDGGLDLPFTTSFPADNAGGIRWMNGLDNNTAFGLFVNGGLWFQGDVNLANSAFGVRSPNSGGALGNISFVVRPNGNVGIGTESPGTRLHVRTKTLFNEGYSYGIALADSADPAKRLNLGFDADLNAGVIQSSHDFVSWDRNLLLNPNAGNVGIGTTDPERKLHVQWGSAGTVTSNNFSVAVLESSKDGYLSILAPSFAERGVLFGDELHAEDGGIIYAGDNNRLDLRTNGNNTRVSISSIGRVGIGTTNPAAQLHLGYGDLFVGNVPTPFTVSQNLYVENSLGDAKNSFRIDGYSDDLAIIARSDAGSTHSTSISFRTSQNGFGETERVRIDANGRVGIGTATPEKTLDVIGAVKCIGLVSNANVEVTGRTKTGTLEITGGADLAEPFAIANDVKVAAGAVVVIDDEHPGQLKLSHVSYDGRVAGVVSGAGGINPGLTLMQKGMLDSGQNVALSGRVYVLATAANGSIRPGDLLTTSDVPGRAMRATDRERSQGCVLGKAMTELDQGEGLILILVNLQ